MLDGMHEWQNRPLDSVYPVLSIGCVHVKLRGGQVANRPICVVLAVTVEGTQEILGLWAGDGGEGAKYWLQVLTEIKNRGTEDVCMVVCDGGSQCLYGGVVEQIVMRGRAKRKKPVSTGVRAASAPLAVS
ncbi:hypothetical protein ADK54_33400 [Streptomyces sp. WM6378]|nr:hypothetical protein ADK54_33400 [Streptomyces sp. WM6378]